MMTWGPLARIQLREEDNLHLDHHISGHQSTSYHHIWTFLNFSHPEEYFFEVNLRFESRF